MNTMNEPNVPAPANTSWAVGPRNQSRTPWAGNIVRGSITGSYLLPTGIEPLHGLPMPPFASRHEHKIFLDSLRIHVDALGGLDGSLPASLLNSTLASVNLEQKTLSEVELKLCCSTFFPAPWALGDLAELLADGLARFRPTPEGGWRLFSDPDYEAKPDPEGGWLLLCHERGYFDEDKLDANYDLCLLWMAMAFGRGWGTNEFEFDNAKFVAPEAAARIRELGASTFNVARAMAERGQSAQQAALAPQAAGQLSAESPGWFRRLFHR